MPTPGGQNNVRPFSRIHDNMFWFPLFFAMAEVRLNLDEDKQKTRKKQTKTSQEASFEEDVTCEWNYCNRRLTSRRLAKLELQHGRQFHRRA